MGHDARLALDDENPGRDLKHQVRELAKSEALGTLRLRYLHFSSMVSGSAGQRATDPGRQVLTHAGSEGETRAWLRRIGGSDP